MTKSYSELIRLSSFSDRLDYLRTQGEIGIDTFGADRYLNQNFYRSEEWKSARRFVIARDNGCDLGMPGHYIKGHIYVHHIVPVTIDMVMANDPRLLSLENLISVSKRTHNYIHYGIEVPENDPYEIIERTANDTIPWRR